MSFLKPTAFLFLALMGFGMGAVRLTQHDWRALPDMFFGAMFFVMFLQAIQIRR